MRPREAWASLVAGAYALVARRNRGEPGPLSRIIPSWLAAQPLPLPTDYRRLADQGYRQMALIYACIQELATSASEPEVHAAIRRPDGTLVDLPATHPLQHLLEHPNPECSTYEFLAQSITNLNTSGNFYIHKERNRYGLPVELWNLRPDRTRVKPAPTGEVELFEYGWEGQFPRQYAAAADVIHGKLYNPLDDYYGLSPIAVLARWGDLDNNAADYLRAYFYNAGAPSGILKFKTRVEREERERVKAQWRDAHSGFTGWHNVSVLDADAEYQSLGGAPERLRLNYIFDATETRICMAFGVPPIVVGAAIGLNRSTFANYKEARASMWEETLGPLYKRLGAILTRGLRDDYGSEVVVYFKLDDVAAFQEDHAVRRAYGLEAWNAGLMTRNEAREWAGLPPDKVLGDEYKQEAAPAPFGGGDMLAEPLAGLFARGGALADPGVSAALRDMQQQVQAALRNGHSNGNGHHPPPAPKLEPVVDVRFLRDSDGLVERMEGWRADGTMAWARAVERHADGSVAGTVEAPA